MQIYQLRDGVYVLFDVFRTFAYLPLTTEIRRFLAQKLEIGEIAMICSFRNCLRQTKAD